MCFAPKIPAQQKIAPTPEKDPNAGLSQMARLEARRRRGTFANIFTSALGDSSFGENIRRATVLGGQTAQA